MNPTLLSWISNQQHSLEQLIVDTAQAFHKEHLDDKNYPYHLQIARMESRNLARGEDLCYDTPAIGLMYSLWYQPRRINTCLCIIAEALSRSSGKSIDLFDLGSGLGAMQWACGLVCAGMQAHGIEPPDLRIVSIDTSPFMMTYQRRLWASFVKHYPACKAIQSEYEINSWTNTREDYNPIWISASYLFDHSDKKDLLTRDFFNLIDLFEPEEIFLSSSNQPTKSTFILHLTRQLLDEGYEYTSILDPQPFTGELQQMTMVREKLDEMLRVPTSKTVHWHEFSFFGTALQKKQTDLAFNRRSSPQNKKQGIDLFNPPIVVRHDITLSTDQKEAAIHRDQPTFIYGPAGCGKSVVITERIKNLAESANYAENFRILLTTFNKALIATLYKWLDDILDPEFVSQGNASLRTYSEHEFFFRNSQTANITLMHFDILPTRIGKFKATVMDESERTRIIEGIIDEVREEMIQEKLKVEKPERILNVEFIRDEYDRVVYGLWLQDEASYLNGQRPGRPVLHANQRPRQLAWRCVSKLHQAILDSRRQPFVYKRMLLLEMLKKGKHNDLFTHVFVDEFQDCTESDFTIFYHLLDNPNHIVVGGDLAQALRLGRSASFPRLPQTVQKNRKSKPLEGSYRLPFRISESLLKLSSRIRDKRKMCGDNNDVRLLNPYKGSPPGARPIVIWAEDADTLAHKIISALNTYTIYDFDRVKVMETDRTLSSAINQGLPDILVGGDSILRIKGLECPCVIWSTRIPVMSEEDAEEFAYTILTRTSGLLIIAICPETLNMYKPILNTFDKKRLIFWDGKSWHRFEQFCEDKDLSGEYEPFDSDTYIHAEAIDDLLPF